ncbi:MAG: 50S ribosomal protein L32 [Candidatus Magasanikbacteria bacterium]|nr:50S ribosomal protein L32 [Candidatus Magasanikbacteria bacterium]
MALPAKQRTRTSKKQRASHFALSKMKLNKCEKCGKKTEPHKACLNCGYYKGRQVINKLKKDKKK